MKWREGERKWIRWREGGIWSRWQEGEGEREEGREGGRENESKT